MFFFSSRRRHTRYWRDWSSDVCSSDLPVEGGLRALAAVPNNLPSAVSSFVGRIRERAQLAELLSTHRLLTVTGPGGCGRSEERRVGKEGRSRWSPDH